MKRLPNRQAPRPAPFVPAATFYDAPVYEPAHMRGRKLIPEKLIGHARISVYAEAQKVAKGRAVRYSVSRRRWEVYM